VSERDLDILLPAIAAGDTSSFATWMAQAEPRVRLSLRRFAAAVDVEVVVQETLLKIWQVAPRVERDGRANALLRLAVRIARNQAISETRKRRPEYGASDDIDPSGGPISPPDPMLRKAVEDCHEQLPDKPRVALGARLSSTGTRDDAALAASLGMRKNTFLQNITRARKLLAECLEDKGVELMSEMA
jgi:RNA polymerase sigma-70 factor (ECF subfamily)